MPWPQRFPVTLCHDMLSHATKEVQEKHGEHPKFLVQFTEAPKAFTAGAFLKDPAEAIPVFKNLGGGLDHKFSKLRVPQSDALLKLRKVLLKAPAESKLIIILPTGALSRTMCHSPTKRASMS